MEAKITDTKLFRMLFQYVARLIDVAHFDVKKDLFRVRSIDPHDFCYVDIVLYPNFFEKYVADDESSFAIECSKLSRIVPTLTAPEIYIKIDEGYIQFSTKENWMSAFGIRWLRTDPYNLPEPKIFDYEATVNIPAKELANIIRKASTISHEVTFSADKLNKLTVFAARDNYSFVAQPLSPHFQIQVKQPVTVSIILDYLKTLQYFINRCESAKVFIGNEKPLRIDLTYEDKGTFSFLFSHRRKEKAEKVKKTSRGGTSLPRVSMNTFERYVIQLSKYPEGADPKILEIAGLETKGGDCRRLSDILSLAYKEKGKVKLTPPGEAFVSLYEKDEEKAKRFLHVLAKSTIKPYELMVEVLEAPLAQEELREKINAVLKREGEHQINGQDLSTMLEIAKWCNILKKKGGLLSFEEDPFKTRFLRKIYALFH